MSNKPNPFEHSVVEKTKEPQELSKPKLYHVIVINDNFTTFDFVVYVIIRFFYKNQKEAEVLTIEIHEKGRGIAGVFSRDEAETKAKMVIECARENEYPLLCEVEPI